MTKPPKKWNKTIKELVEETRQGNRMSVNKQELEWARVYELSTLPSGTRFPRDGEIYEARKDIKVHFMISWAAPSSSGGEAMLFLGERIKVESPWREKRPLGSYAIPIDYEKIERG
jgi:hypothetical protein